MSLLKDRINADLKSAMLARDVVRTQTLQGLKAAILNEEVAQKVRDIGLAEQEIEKIIARECKKRDEAAELFDRGGNAESAAKERIEKEILQVYLPQQMSETELNELIEATIAEVKPAGMQDMGRVIGAVKAKAGNTADGALVARLTKEKLS